MFLHSVALNPLLGSNTSLHVITLKEITRCARERHAGAMGYAETLVNYYNKKNRSPLRWDKLYSHKNGSRKKAPSNGSTDFAGYPNTEGGNEPFPPFASTDDEAIGE